MKELGSRNDSTHFGGHKSPHARFTWKTVFKLREALKIHSERGEQPPI